MDRAERHKITQRVTLTGAAVNCGLASLQIVFGFIMGFAHMGFDVLHDVIPFNAARSSHLNLLVFWLLSGFMGAAYYIVPEEADRELVSEKLAVVQWAGLVIVGVAAIIGFQFGWWEGRKFLEIPRPLDYLVVVDVLLFIYIVGRTALGAERFTTTGSVLLVGLTAAALLYLPGMITFDSQVIDSYFRWWVVHLWVEGVWELIMGGILSFLLIKLTGVDRELIEKWLYVIIGFTFLSGILGTGHHYYYIGTPEYWLWIGGIFSGLEPLAFHSVGVVGMVLRDRYGVVCRESVRPRSERTTLAGRDYAAGRGLLPGRMVAGRDRRLARGDLTGSRGDAPGAYNFGSVTPSCP